MTKENATIVLSEQTRDRLLAAPADDFKPDQLAARYPARKLADAGQVTRIGPSPTGFMHIGTMYVALLCERVARQTDGVYYLRLEDTDRKREVAGAAELVMSLLQTLDLAYDEGPLPDGGELGAYGPYTQSRRQPIYEAYVRQLLDEGKAYACFVTPEEQEQTYQQQTAAKVRPGYYGQWATWRDRSEADVVEALDAGKPFVIRFRSEGQTDRKRHIHDLVKGEKDLPENDNDIVILKADGLPTYHLAHAVDDHLMGTTLVIRADEWLASLTLHIQLFEALGFAPCQYAHIAPIQKMDGSSRRKLSKRKDPEADMSYYLQQGYPVVAIKEYLMNLANSDFEDWRRSNPTLPLTAFEFKIDRLPKNSGALLNLQKLDDVSRDILAALPVEQLYELSLAWARTYDLELADALAADPHYTQRVFSIERDNNKRKDMVKLSQLRDEYGYFFDPIFDSITPDTFVEAGFNKVDQADRQKIAKNFLDGYSADDPQDVWFEKIKAVGSELGFTPNTKEFRQNPAAFKGSVAEVAMVLRVALTGRNRSPNLHEVMQAMGVDRITRRLSL